MFWTIISIKFPQSTFKSVIFMEKSLKMLKLQNVTSI